MNTLRYHTYLCCMCDTMDRWLHPDDPDREAYGPELPPPARTHREACREAKQSEKSVYGWENKDNHPRYKSGINNWCPLSVLMKFNMIWDFCPDMMHIIKTWFERLVIGVFSGERRPHFSGTKPAPLPKRTSNEEKQQHKTAMAKYKKKLQAHERECVAFDMCIFDMHDRKIVDARVKNLVGYPDWIKSTLVNVILYLSIMPFFTSSS